MRSLPARVLVGVAAIAALVLGYALPGSYVLAAGMLAYFVLPLLLGLPIGEPLPADDGVRIVSGRNAAQRLDASVRVLGVFAWLGYAWAASLGRDGIVGGVFALLAGNGTALLAAWGLFARVLTPVRDAHGVTLERETLTVNGEGGSHVLRYGALRNVEVDGKRIWLTTDDSRHVIDVLGSPKLAADIAAAILDAKAKALRDAAHDDRKTKELRRPSGMSAREWLGRIDALAAAGRDRSAYRGSALDEDELWALLRDEAADADARAAAARMLAASPDEAVRTRVAATVSEIPRGPARARVELAMKPDTESTAHELEDLDIEELRKTAGL